MNAPRPIALVGGARLPLGFIAFGLASLAAATSWLAANPSLALVPHVHPHIIALAHLWLPGFLLSVCFGATYQLTPVVLGVPLHSERSPWLHLWLHAIGLPALVTGFVLQRYDLVAAGGSFVAAGALLFASCIWRTFAISSRRDAVGWSFPLAAGWLALTVIAGVLVALNRHAPHLAWSPFALLRTHAHLGFVGFFLTLIQGAAFQLVPMFTLSTSPRPGRVALGLAGSQSGLLLLAPGFAWELPLLTSTGAALLTAGIAFSGAELAASLRLRRKQRLEPGLRAFVIGAASVVLALATGVALLLAPPGAASLRAISAYGLIVVAGALALMVLGMLSKIIPFLVWMRAYGPRVGRQPVPPAHSLGSPLLENAWLVTHLAAVVLLAAGTFLGAIVIVSAGAFTLALGVGCYLANSFRILAHLRGNHRPTSPVPATSPS